MSLGANFSSGYTENLQNTCVRPVSNDSSNQCQAPGSQAVARLPSIVLLEKVCPSPTPAQFALYPKVAVPSSIRTQGIMDRVTSQRFSQYRRYTAPTPCPPLPPSMAGISQPSTRLCNS